MQTGSSETLIGWKTGKPLLSLYGASIYILTKTGFHASNQRQYDMNSRSQMQGGKKQFAFVLLDPTTWMMLPLA
jgi:hypothetical protein